MKFVAISGGLGNQMFGYAFMVRLSQKEKTYLFHPYKDNSEKYGHAGYQLNEIFYLRHVDTKKHFVVFLFSIYYRVLSLLPRKVGNALLNLVGINTVTVPQNFVFFPEVLQSTGRRELLKGTWQSEKYFQGAEQEVRKALTFKEKLLNDKTKQLKEKIERCEAVSLHVRRDDYLSLQYVQGFGGICTLSYYKSAVENIKDLIVDPVFFVFSDDIGWCRANIDIPNAVFVDWNKGNESWQDMFLMSKCKYNIIANSSFSWWGAWLNEYPGKIVVAPDKWWNGLKDEVVPEEWIRISGEQKE